MRKSRLLHTLLIGSMVLCLTAGFAFAEGQAEKKASGEWPTRAIDVVVGWSAGGTSDTTVRALAREMSDYLGVEVRVNNMEGANGGIAYQNVYNAPADGYRWFGGAQVQATYPITKQAKVGWEMMYPYPAGMGATTIYVMSDSEYQTLPDLIDAIKEADGTVKYGTTSRGGNGSIFAGALAEVAGVADKVQEVPYDGGREAGRYLLSGAVEFISTSLGDVSDWAEEGRIRPIANLYRQDFEWRGVTFPTVVEHYPELLPYTSINPYWGIAIRRDTPDEIVTKISEAFAYAVQQDRFKEALEARGIIVDPLMGVEADMAAAKVGAGRGWAQFDYGIVDTSPAEFNIPRISEWEWPPNEAAANVAEWPEKVQEIFATEIVGSGELGAEAQTEAKQ